MQGVLAACLLFVPASTACFAAACSAERDIRAGEAKVTQAYETNDLATYFSYYAADLRALFPEGPTNYPDYVKSWTQFVQAGGGVDHFVIRNMVVQVGANCDAAVASYQAVAHTKNPGKPATVEHFDETDVWFRRDGIWKIVEIHYSKSGGK